MKNKISPRCYIGDAVLCILIAVLTVCVSVMFIIKKDRDNRQVRILCDGYEFGIYDLSKDTYIDIDGVHIEISGGKAVISDSDCPDKVCKTMAGVDKNGGGAVCIPNKVVLEPVTTSDLTDAVAG